MHFKTEEALLHGGSQTSHTLTEQVPGFRI